MHNSSSAARRLCVCQAYDGQLFVLSFTPRQTFEEVFAAIDRWYRDFPELWTMPRQERLERQLCRVLSRSET